MVRRRRMGHAEERGAEQGQDRGAECGEDRRAHPEVAFLAAFSSRRFFRRSVTLLSLFGLSRTRSHAVQPFRGRTPVCGFAVICLPVAAVKFFVAQYLTWAAKSVVGGLPAMAKDHRLQSSPPRPNSAIGPPTQRGIRQISTDAAAHRLTAPAQAW